MIRVKFIRNHKDYRKGQTIALSPNEAFGLIDKGYAMVSKDLVAEDYVQAKLDTAETKLPRLAGLAPEED